MSLNDINKSEPLRIISRDKKRIPKSYQNKMKKNNAIKCLNSQQEAELFERTSLAHSRFISANRRRSLFF